MGACPPRNVMPRRGRAGTPHIEVRACTRVRHRRDRGCEHPGRDRVVERDILFDARGATAGARAARAGRRIAPRPTRSSPTTPSRCSTRSCALAERATCPSPPCTGSSRTTSGSAGRSGSWPGSPATSRPTPAVRGGGLAARGVTRRPGARRGGAASRPWPRSTGPTRALLSSRPRRSRRPARPPSSTSTSGSLSGPRRAAPSPREALDVAPPARRRRPPRSDARVGRRPAEQPHLPRLRGGRRPRLGDGDASAIRCSTSAGGSSPTTR